MRGWGRGWALALGAVAALGLAGPAAAQEKKVIIGVQCDRTGPTQIVGTVLCGFLLAATGFMVTFLALAATGVISLIAGLATPPKPRKKEAGAAHPLASYLPLLRKRIIIYTMMCAYLSALPFSLTMSFYPLLLAQFGHGEGESGVLLALRAVGSIFASLLAGRFVRTGPQTGWPVVCGLAVAASIGFVPTVNHAAPIAFWMLLVGAGTAAMTLYFQITISEASTPEERGSALALGGLGWSVSHLSTPLIMGFLADRYGLVVGFYVLGGFALACALLIAATRGWAFARG